MSSLTLLGLMCTFLLEEDWERLLVLVVVMFFDRSYLGTDLVILDLEGLGLGLILDFRLFCESRILFLIGDLDLLRLLVGD